MMNRPSSNKFKGHFPKMMTSHDDLTDDTLKIGVCQKFKRGKRIGAAEVRIIQLIGLLAKFEQHKG
jgi:hypothetical protein